MFPHSAPMIIHNSSCISSRLELSGDRYADRDAAGVGDVEAHSRQLEAAVPALTVVELRLSRVRVLLAQVVEQQVQVPRALVCVFIWDARAEQRNMGGGYCSMVPTHPPWHHTQSFESVTTVTRVKIRMKQTSGYLFSTTFFGEQKRFDVCFHLTQGNIY